MRALPEGTAPGDLNQGLMELGATICAATQPRCLVCPLVRDCAAARSGRQDELPVVAVRKKASELPLIARTVVWVEGEGAIVLVRRTPEGLFGGLWELPPLEVAEAMGVTIDRAPVACHDQVLTHRRLRIAVVRGAMPATLVVPADSGYDAVTLVVIADARRFGIAASTAAILGKHEDTPWSSIQGTRPVHRGLREDPRRHQPPRVRYERRQLRRDRGARGEGDPRADPRPGAGPVPGQCAARQDVPAKYTEMVISKHNTAFGVCPHHLLPVVYRISMAYIPTNKVLGLSKLSRLARMIARGRGCRRT